MPIITEQIKANIQKTVFATVSLGREISDDELLAVIDAAICEEGKSTYIGIHDREKLKKVIFDSIRGLDVLQELVDDENITEIMVNGTGRIYIEKEGRVFDSGRHFSSDEKLHEIINQIVTQSNRMINESSPIVDARLKDGSRVNVVLNPVSLDGAAVTIRKFPKEIMTIGRLIEIGSITEEAADFLEKLVIAGYNIFVSGGTGSGKTTFLNALSCFIPKDERIITIEDSAELQIRNVPNLVRLECRNPNVEGNNGIDIRTLIKTSLRMRPDRIIVGEVRDAAAIDMLQAMNTGHNGMSTGHANSPYDAVSRLETMVLLGNDIPLLAVRKQIASAIDIIVQLGRLRDKSRRVLSICEVNKSIENGDVVLNTLFEFEEKESTQGSHVEGGLVKSGKGLMNTIKLKHAGISI
jgi:pilus assembly protein CpaF